MKVILSRKGIDAGMSKKPSPIIGKNMLSIPIPTSGISYDDIQSCIGLPFGKVLSDLQIPLKYGANWTNAHTTGHLDPDLDINAIARKPGWRPAFGQISAAQTHLKNKGVQEGDLFLFFGWFEHAEILDGVATYKKSNSEGFHAIFGYMEIGEIYEIKTRQDLDNLPEWLMYHPHCKFALGETESGNNTVYVASERLSWNDRISGAGLLREDDKGRLSKPGLSRSKWQLDPAVFKDATISYHTKDSWKDDYFQTVGRGQEFVIDDNPKVEKWAQNLIEQLQPA